MGCWTTLTWWGQNPRLQETEFARCQVLFIERGIIDPSPVNTDGN